jgi:hypothetical protein
VRRDGRKLCIRLVLVTAQRLGVLATLLKLVSREAMVEKSY